MIPTNNNASAGGGWGEFLKGAPTVVTAGLGAALGMAGLPMFTLPLYIGPLHEAFGWSRADIGITFSIMTGCIFLGSPLIGRLADRVGVRGLVLTSVILLSLAMFLLGMFTQEMWHFYVGYLLIGVLGAGTTYVCYSRILTTWFHDHRGLALGMMMTGPGLVAALGPFIVTPMINEHGWRYTWLAMSPIPLLVLPLVWFFLREGPFVQRTKENVAVGFSSARIRRSRAFWLMLPAVFTVTLGMSAMHVHIVAIIRELGLDAAGATIAAGALGGAMVAGRFITGLLIDRIFAPIVGFTLTVLASLSVFGAMFGVVPPIFMAAGIGLVFGMEADFMAYSISRYFGLRCYSETFGYVFGFMALGAACSPIWFGWMLNKTGGYMTGLTISASLLMVSALCIAAMGRFPKSFDEPGAQR